MTAKKLESERHPLFSITLRPDQSEKAKRLQRARRLSAICQAAVDAVDEAE